MNHASDVISLRVGTVSDLRACARGSKRVHVSVCGEFTVCPRPLRPAREIGEGAGLKGIFSKI